MDRVEKLFRVVSRALMLCLLMLATGCGSAESGRGVPISGTITFDGKPLEGATVTFMNDTFVGFGRTDAEGNYRLAQGALPGKNKVVISKIEGGAQPADVIEDPEAGMDAGQFEAAAMGTGVKVPTGPKDLIPADYSDPSKTKLTWDVPAGGETGVNFNI